MSKITKIQWKSSNPQDWKAQRDEVSGIGLPHCRIGASDIATLTGNNAWKSKRRLFLSLVGLYDKTYISNDLLLGHEMEPHVAHLFEHYNTDEETFLNNRYYRTPERKLKEADFFLINEEFPNMFVSLDYIPDGDCFSPWTGELYGELTPIECKYIRDFVYKTWDSPIPPNYYDQLQAQLAVTGESIGVFAPRIRDGEFYPVEVERNDEYIEYLKEVTGEFGIIVTKGKILAEQIKASTDALEIHDLNNELEDLTPIDPIEDSEDLAKELMESGDDYLAIEPDGKEDNLIREYQMATQDEKDLKGRKHAIKAELTNIASGYAGIESDNFRVIIRGNNHPTKGAYFRIYNK